MTQKQSGIMGLTQQQGEIMEKLREICPDMPIFDKGYFLGKVERIEIETTKTNKPEEEIHAAAI